MATYAVYAWVHHCSHASPEDVCPGFRDGIEEPVAAPRKASKAERRRKAMITNQRDFRYEAFRIRAEKAANLERLKPLAMWYLFCLRNRRRHEPTREDYNAWLEVRDSLR